MSTLSGTDAAAPPRGRDACGGASSHGSPASDSYGIVEQTHLPAGSPWRAASYSRGLEIGAGIEPAHAGFADQRVPISPPDHAPTPDIATSAPIRKRAELAGEIEALDARLAQLRTNLVHLDAAIRIMCPDAEPGLIRAKKPSRKGCDWFGWGSWRAVFSTCAGAPLTTTEIARAVVERKGLPVDGEALQRVAGMVKGVLRRQDGRTVERDGGGWRIDDGNLLL